jgi:hypothetical protein
MGYLVRISFLGYNLKSYPDYHKISYNILSYPIISFHILSYPKISSGANSQMLPPQPPPLPLPTGPACLAPGPALPPARRGGRRRPRPSAGGAAPRLRAPVAQLRADSAGRWVTSACACARNGGARPSARPGLPRGHAGSRPYPTRWSSLAAWYHDYVVVDFFCRRQFILNMASFISFLIVFDGGGARIVESFRGTVGHGEGRPHKTRGAGALWPLAAAPIQDIPIAGPPRCGAARANSFFL